MAAADINSLIDQKLQLLIQYHSAMVSPCIEYFRDSTYRVNIAYGGRGAGAKSWGFDSLIVQRANREKLRIACFREIQESLKESSYYNIIQQVHRLGYEGWTFLKDSIQSPSGSYFIFRGLKDIRAANQIKSYEDFDIFRIEEASTIIMDSWIMVMPTLRKKGSQFFITFNPENDSDPVMELFINNRRDDCLAVFCEPGEIDNPWWNDTELPKESAEMKKRDPEGWIHVFGGQPRPQGHNAVMSRILVNKAMEREIVNPEGQRAIGCDVSDMGDDKTTIYMRKGLKVVHREAFRIPSTELQPGKYVSDRIRKVAGNDVSIPIYLDATGIGASARDFCRGWSKNVIAINFANNAHDKNKYADLPTELWFSFKENYLDKCDLIRNNDLSQELSGRQYGYDHENRYKIESKADFKKRLGRSPDDADGLLLCFYNPLLRVNEKLAAGMAARNRRNQ